ncbi:DUF6477 family protein [Cribrihabitans neustonicus]|uniref:DUF6477 family protein n=1 Tax=Cribrihabitans neustonicus TaxID=1429085 RepID=UPI003B5A575A
MQDLYSRLTALRRPRLLSRSARLGAQSYCRKRDLPRVLGYGPLPRPAEAALQLMELEQGMEESRQRGEAGYSLIRHVELLIALAGEAEYLERLTSASGWQTAAAAGRRAERAEGFPPCPPVSAPPAA